MNVTVSPYEMHGRITAPPSKSASHRNVIAAAMAKGESVIENVDMSSDINATIRGCETLGCSVRVESAGRYNVLHIKGGLKIKGGVNINCEESGSTLRFLIPVACTVEGKKIFTGSGRLPERPIDEYINIFENEGIRFEKPQGKSLPLKVTGKLSGGEYVLSGNVSSQYISGLMFALPVLEKDSEITITGKFESKGYADMTADTLRGFGVETDSTENGYIIKGNQEYKPRSIKVEGDWSQAAFLIAGAALSGKLTIEGLKADSLQPDRVIVDIMKRMGADIQQFENSIKVRKSALHGIEIDVSQCPDLVPPIAAAAALAEGKTKIYGAARLRIKESDRLKTLWGNLNKLGVRAEESPDSLTIYGGGIKGGEADSYGDHRITMALSILALRAPITITGAESINKSYPGFFEDLKSVGGNVE